MPEVAFLPGWLYQDPAVAQWDRDGYAKQWWHPLAAVSQLQPGQAVALPLLGDRCCSPVSWMVWCAVFATAAHTAALS